MVEGYFDTDGADGLANYITHSVVFAATTAMVWWFGDRGMTPPALKER